MTTLLSRFFDSNFHARITLKKAFFQSPGLITMLVPESAALYHTAKECCSVSDDLIIFIAKQ